MLVFHIGLGLVFELRGAYNRDRFADKLPIRFQEVAGVFGQGSVRFVTERQVAFGVSRTRIDFKLNPNFVGAEFILSSNLRWHFSISSRATWCQSAGQSAVIFIAAGAVKRNRI